MLLHGKDRFYKSDMTKRLRAALEKVHGEVDLILIDADTTPLVDALDECRSFGLMASHKLVVVDPAEKLVNQETRPILERYCESPSDGATLVLRAETWRPGNLDKKIAAVGAVVKCESPTESAAADWVLSRAKRHKCSIDRNTAWLLVERYGADLGKLDSELQKLAIAAIAQGGEGAAITPELVGTLSGGAKEINPWQVQQALSLRNPAAAVAGVRAILDNAHKEAHIPALMGATQLAYKVHARAAATESGMRAGLGKPYAIWPRDLEAVADGIAKREGVEGSRALLRAALEADAGAKSGLGRPDRSLEILTLRFNGVI